MMLGLYLFPFYHVHLVSLGFDDFPTVLEEYPCLTMIPFFLFGVSDMMCPVQACCGSEDSDLTHIALNNHETRSYEYSRRTHSSFTTRLISDIFCDSDCWKCSKDEAHCPAYFSLSELHIPAIAVELYFVQSR